MRRARIKVAPNVAALSRSSKTETDIVNGGATAEISDVNNCNVESIQENPQTVDSAPVAAAADAVNSNNNNNNAAPLKPGRFRPRPNILPRSCGVRNGGPQETGSSAVDVLQPLEISVVMAADEQVKSSGGSGKVAGKEDLPAEALCKPATPAVAPVLKPAAPVVAPVSKPTAPSVTPVTSCDEARTETVQLASESANVPTSVRMKQKHHRPNIDTASHRNRTYSSASESEDEGKRRMKAQIPDSAKKKTAVDLYISQIQTARMAAGEKVKKKFGEKSQIEIRKDDMRKKFSKGQVDLSQMTMFDLIYYNPDGEKPVRSKEKLNTRRVNLDPPPKETLTVSNPIIQDKLDEEEEEVRILNGEDDVEPADDASNKAGKADEEEEDECEAEPVPQLRVGPDGQLVLDEQSLVIETTETKRNKDELAHSGVVIENSAGLVNYGSWAKRRRSSKWTVRETARFYRALGMLGTDFSLMESLFRGRTRFELKRKFKIEEKINRALIDKTIGTQKPFDETLFGEETDDDLETEEDDEEDAEEYEKKSSAGKRKKRKTSNEGDPVKRQNNILKDGQSRGAKKGKAKGKKSPTGLEMDDGKEADEEDPAAAEERDSAAAEERDPGAGEGGNGQSSDRKVRKRKGSTSHEGVKRKKILKDDQGKGGKKKKGRGKKSRIMILSSDDEGGEVTCDFDAAAEQSREEVMDSQKKRLSGSSSKRISLLASHSMPAKNPVVVTDKDPSFESDKDPAVVPPTDSTVLPTKDPTVLPDKDTTVLPVKDSPVLPAKDITVLPVKDSPVVPAKDLIAVPPKHPTVTPVKDCAVAPGAAAPNKDPSNPRTTTSQNSSTSVPKDPLSISLEEDKASDGNPSPDPSPAKLSVPRSSTRNVPKDPLSISSEEEELTQAIISSIKDSPPS